MLRCDMKPVQNQAKYILSRPSKNYRDHRCVPTAQLGAARDRLLLILHDRVEATRKAERTWAEQHGFAVEEFGPFAGFTQTIGMAFTV